MEHKQKNKLSVRMRFRHIVWISSVFIAVLSAGFFLFMNVTGVHHSTASTEADVELAYFKAELRGGAVVFSWATNVEANIDYFMVERSTDGIHFVELLRQPASGTSTVRIYYSDMDENPVQGYSYYRLRHTHFDGHFSYSEVRTVKYKTNGSDESELEVISISPNPFNEKFTLSYILKASATVNLRMINTAGQTVVSKEIHSTDGMTQYNFIDVNSLPEGVYFITLLYFDKKVVRKIIKTSDYQNF